MSFEREPIIITATAEQEPHITKVHRDHRLRDGRSPDHRQRPELNTPND